jgi:hypothetical protein
MSQISSANELSFYTKSALYEIQVAAQAVLNLYRRESELYTFEKQALEKRFHLFSETVATRLEECAARESEHISLIFLQQLLRIVCESSLPYDRILTSRQDVIASQIVKKGYKGGYFQDLERIIPLVELLPPGCFKRSMKSLASIENAKNRASTPPQSSAEIRELPQSCKSPTAPLILSNSHVEVCSSNLTS